jgi:tetratricopeptide (TPR) repeat protein
LRAELKIGELLVLAQEAADARQRAALVRSAADLLQKTGQLEFALAQVDAALATDANDLIARRQKGLLLARANKFAAARDWAENIVNDHPKDAASWSLLGEVEKEEWVWRWRKTSIGPMRDRAAQETHLLVQAIEPFHAAISLDHTDFRSGLNALVLRHLLFDLAGEDHHPVSMHSLREAVRLAATNAIKKNSGNYAARAALAELALLQGDLKQAMDDYRAAFPVADWFALDSTRRELTVLDDLQFRPDSVRPALEALQQEMQQRAGPWQPRNVFLFSGHMIDHPEREEPRFPPAAEGVAAAAIARQLDTLAAGAPDLAICGGACGGDLLFAEASLQRGLRLEVHLQFAEAEFLEESVAFAGQNWVERYCKVKANPLTEVLVMPDRLGALPAGIDPYSRNNLWQLYSALANGPRRVRFIALWNGEAGDGPGGTKHMVEIVEKHSGQAYILDTKALWNGSH